MPYIDRPARVAVDAGERPRKPGELNYVITRILLQYLPTEPTYTDYNEVVGVLECVKQELYRRAVAPYEDKKAAAHGDLRWPQI